MRRQLQAVPAIPREGVLEPHEDHRAEHGDEHRVEKSAGARETDRAHDESSDDRAEYADDDIGERAVAAAFENLSGRPSGDESNADPPDHGTSRASVEPGRHDAAWEALRDVELWSFRW